jgi:hypothetical protein
MGLGGGSINAPYRMKRKRNWDIITRGCGA